MSNKKKWIIIAVVVVLVLAIFGSAGSNSSKSESSSTETQKEQAQTWSTAEDDLFGMTVEAAWDKIEAKGYTIKIVSKTGAELNSDESNHHSSTSQAWRVADVEEVDEKAKTVTVEATSDDDFVKRFTAGAKK